MTPLRLQVFLARAGLASRRKCEELIAAGQVRVNGQVVTELGSKVDPVNDRVQVDGKRVVAEKPVYVLLHKPRGYVTTADDPEGRPTVMQMLRGISERARVFPVGRLDFHTDGALILTNDGELANVLMHPSRGVPKTYHAKFKGELTPDAVEKLRGGVTLDDGSRTQPAEVRVLESVSRHTWCEIVIKEGKNRQLHRMADAIGYPLLKLSRVRYGNLTVDDMAPGRWRELDPREVADLRKLAGGKKPAPAKKPTPVSAPASVSSTGRPSAPTHRRKPRPA